MFTLQHLYLAIRVWQVIVREMSCIFAENMSCVFTLILEYCWFLGLEKTEQNFISNSAQNARYAAAYTVLHQLKRNWNDHN